MKVPLSALSFKALNDRWLRLIGIPAAVVPFVALTILAYGFNGPLILLMSVWGLISTTFLWHLLLWWVLNVRMEYPGRENTRKRISKTFGGYSLFTILDQIVETRILYQIDPSGLIPEPVFPDDYFIPVAIALFFVVVVGSYYEGSYNLQQYRKAVEQAEAAKKNQLQTELIALKNKVNPHFLFNSLNSLSALINEDQSRANLFLDELASVYRYMLQASQRSLVPLSDEFAFLEAYQYLLNERYGSALHWNLDITPSSSEWVLPPLTIQTLVDNALKYNRLSRNEPLTINICYSGKNQLEVSNIIQPKSAHVASLPGGLSQLVTQFIALGLPPMHISDNGQLFQVSLTMPSQSLSELNPLAI